METYITGKTSLVQRIDNSLVFREVFKKFVEEQEAAGGCKAKISNLRAAKHRFESLSAPLSRLVLFFPAMLRTAAYISSDRAGRAEGSNADDFLRSMTPARLLQLAMMADAADEAMRLIRACDCEDVGVGLVHQHVSDFLARIRGLFNDCLCLGTGFTKYVLDLLEEGVHIFQGERGAWRIGGPGKLTAAAKGAAIAHMQAWVRLAEAVVAAEFPDFEVFAAFSVFEVSEDRGRPAPHQSTPTQTKMLHHLAQVFNLDRDKLQSQFGDYQGIARNICCTRACSSHEAWREALRQRSRYTQTHPQDALMVVMQRFCGWSCSTSGVEQHFSKMDRTHRFRVRCSERVESDSVRFLGAELIPPQRCTAFAQRCRALWKQHFGEVRCRREDRSDKGLRKPSSQLKPASSSEAGWLRKRREDVSLAVAAGQGQQQLDVPNKWSEDHERELEYQVKKRRKRQVDAALNGQLCEDQVDENLLGEMAKQLESSKKQDAEHARRARRLEKKTLMAESVKWEELSGMKAYIQSMEPEILRAEARRSLLEKGLIITENRLEAKMFVVVDVLEPGLRNKWSAVLAGALLVSVRRLLHGSGPFIKYKPALRIPQEVWMSDNFRSAHPDIAALIQQASTSPGSRWSMVAGDVENFREHVLVREPARGLRRSSVVAGLVTKDELKHLAEALPANTRLHVKADLLNRICRMDLSHSRDDR